MFGGGELKKSSPVPPPQCLPTPGHQSTSRRGPGEGERPEPEARGAQGVLGARHRFPSRSVHLGDTMVVHVCGYK